MRLDERGRSRLSNCSDFRSRTELDAWRAGLIAAGLRLVAERDVTPGVMAALDVDDEWKRGLIEARVARPLVRAFCQFAALRGTMLYDKFRDGSVVYRAFVFQRRQQRLEREVVVAERRSHETSLVWNAFVRHDGKSGPVKLAQP